MRLALGTALDAHARELVSSTQPRKSNRRGASLCGDQTIHKTYSGAWSKMGGRTLRRNVGEKDEGGSGGNAKVYQTMGACG